MPTTLPREKLKRSCHQTADVVSERELLGASVFVALAFCVLTAMLPAEFVLPAVSITVIVSGLVLGAWTLLMSRWRRLPNTRMLDIAGVLVLFGFAAAIVCDKSEALRLLAAVPGS